MKNPQDVRERTKAIVEQVGGRVIGTWYAFGEYDLVSIAEFPDEVSVAAVAIAFAAGGALKAAKTTPLMTVEEGLAAIKKAARATYQPPSA
ncbi:MAG TPA: GYD domain-containing protein [Anaerolineae bacterium]|nr:GYD domain-containing protein [Anaerolineae bacterium]